MKLKSEVEVKCIRQNPGSLLVSVPWSVQKVNQTHDKPQTQKPLRVDVSDLNVNMNFPHTLYVP